MDEISSTEFRKTYAALKATTLVTVNGHIIGTWVPIETGWVGPRAEHSLAQPGPEIAKRVEARAFSTRPFRPVPKGK